MSFVVPSAKPVQSITAPGGGTFELLYKEPFWSGLPPSDVHWKLDVIRSGVTLPGISLEGKACFLVGRLPVCDISLENDTISRQHAVFQNRSNGKLYVFDLGSTHGTFVNYKRIEAKTYVELEAGTHVKFGASARVYVVVGGKDEAVEEVVEKQHVEEEEKEEEEEKKEKKVSKWKKKKNEVGDVFVGSVEDGEKFVKHQEYQRRRKEQKMKQVAAEKKKKRREEGLDDFDDDEDEDDAGGELAGKDGDSLDSDDPENVGEADPDRVQVGTARSDWDDYDDDDVGFIDETQKSKKAKTNLTTKAMSRAEIVEAQADVDVKLRELDAKIKNLKDTGISGVGGGEEDELDAFMDSMKQRSVQEEIAKMEEERAALQAETARLNKMLSFTATILDRVPNADNKKAQSLEERMAKAIQNVDSTKQEARATFVEPTTTQQRVKGPAKIPPNVGISSYVAQFSKDEPTAKALEPATKRRQVIAVPDSDADIDAAWLPPANQKGDGITDLNKKFGY